MTEPRGNHTDAMAMTVFGSKTTRANSNTSRLPGPPPAEVMADALWDVVFSRISCLQEYGWHAGIEATLAPELSEKGKAWTEVIITHAKAQQEFFPPFDSGSTEDFH